MPDTNRISATLTDADIQDINNAIATIRGKLPFLLSLTTEDRMMLPKMGDKSIGFDEKCTAYMDSLPTFVPGFVDMNEVKKDRALRNQLGGIAGDLNSLSGSLDDTLMVVSSEIWMANLAFYQNVRQAAKRSVTGAQAAYSELSQRFPGSNGKATAVTAQKSA